MGGAHHSPEVALHGVLMVLGVSILLPVGVFFPRFCRHRIPHSGPAAWWFVRHQAVQYSAVLCVVIGFGYAVHMTPEDDQFEGVHHRVGLFLFLLILQQPLNAVCRPGFYSPNRPMWVRVHRWLGAAIVGLGVLQVYLGLAQASASPALYVLYTALLAVMTWMYVRQYRSWKATGGTYPTAGFEMRPVSAISKGGDVAVVEEGASATTARRDATAFSQEVTL